AWWTAANRAGTSVVEVYPAGDTAFTGIALLRAEQQLAAIAEAGPATVVGEGSGAAAVIRLACVHPESISALLLIDPQLPGDLACMPHGIPIRVSGSGNPAFRAWRQQSSDIRGSDDDTAPPTDPAFWTAPAAASSARGTAQQMSAVCSTIGPLCGYARGPFVVVVGTGEHLAAQQDDRRLAAQFVAAWSAHAQGVPPVVEDSAFDAKRWSGHHWVLVGNTRSNRVIADLVRSGLRLPVTWDSRSLTVIDDDQRSTYLRAEMRPIAIAMPRPSDPAHTLVLLDGAPAWSGRGLPLAGLPALTIGQPMIPLK
ncbi:MAG: hypothetical protein H0W83_10550, partial [Planctomycetes bacterium]|nr:hypothetical protein [Planctomycetota bacterium]